MRFKKQKQKTMGLFFLHSPVFEPIQAVCQDTLLVNVAISHAQFETIHAYKDGNGRQRNLMELRRGNILSYLKFFMQAIIDQCNNYISKILRINQIYEEDLETIKVIKGYRYQRVYEIFIGTE